MIAMLVAAVTWASLADVPSGTIVTVTTSSTTITRTFVSVDPDRIFLTDPDTDRIAALAKDDVVEVSRQVKKASVRAGIGGAAAGIVADLFLLRFSPFTCDSCTGSGSKLGQLAFTAALPIGLGVLASRSNATIETEVLYRR